MRKLAIAVGIVLALLVIAVIATPYVLDANRYHDRIQSEMRQRLGRRVALGEMRLSIVPLAFRVKDAAIGEDPAFGPGKDFAQAQELTVAAELMPLLGGEVKIQSIELVQPRLELVRNEQGAWNFASLGKPAPLNAPAAQQAPQTAPPPAESASTGYFFEDLKITDGQVAVTDLSKSKGRVVYDHIDLRLVGYAPGKAFSIEAAAHLPGAGKQEIALKGKGGPAGDTALQTPFDGTLTLNEVSLAGLKDFLHSAGLGNTEGVATGTVNISNNVKKLDAGGTLELAQSRINGHEMGFPIRAEFALSDDFAAGRLRLDKGNLKLGETPLSVTGTVITQATPAQLDLKLKTDDVSIEEAARLAAVLGVAFNPDLKVSGRMSADLAAQGAATQPALSGTLRAHDVTMSGKDVPQPVKIAAIELALAPTEIRSNNFTASAGGTTLATRFAVSQYTSGAPSIDADVKTQNASVADVLGMARAYGVSAAQGVEGTGLISLDVHVAGPLKGDLNYSGSGAVENASIKTAAITQPLKVSKATLRFTQNSVALESLAGSLGSTNATGTLTLHGLGSAAPSAQFTLAADKLIAAEWQKILVADVREPSGWELVPSANAAAKQESLLAKLSGGGQMTVATILYDDLVMTNGRATVKLDHGIIHFDPILAELYGGTESGTIVMDARGAATTYAVNMKMDKVDANRLLSSVSSVKNLSGLLATNGQMSFHGAAGAEVTRTLNGAMNLNLAQGKLAGVDILYQLATIGGFLRGSQQSRPFTNFSKVNGDFNIKDGVAQTDNLSALMDDGTLAATGTINLNDQTVKVRAVAVLSKAFSDSVGGTSVGGYLTTALSNRNGELVIPVIISGTLSQPKFAPDVEKMARLKLENLTGGGNAGDLLGGLLGRKKPQPQQGGQAAGQTPDAGQQPQQPQQKKPSWKDILNTAIGGNKQQQPAQPPPPPPNKKQPPPDQPK